MNKRVSLKRLLEAVAFAVLAGGLAYGVMAWLAPNSESALLVASIVAAIVALGVLAPTSLLSALSHPNSRRFQPRETYYDLDYSLKKNSGWED